AFFIQIRAGERPLGAVLARDVILLGSQLRAPLGVSLHDLGTGGIGHSLHPRSNCTLHLSERKMRRKRRALHKHASMSTNDGGQAARASAVLASVLIRSTIERKPFERCGVRCSRKPSFSNSATASVSRIFLAAW